MAKLIYYTFMVIGAAVAFVGAVIATFRGEYDHTLLYMVVAFVFCHEVQLHGLRDWRGKETGGVR